MKDTQTPDVTLFSLLFPSENWGKRNYRRSHARKLNAAIMRLSLGSTDSFMYFCCCYSAPAHYTWSLSHGLQKAFLWHPAFITSASYHVQSKATCNEKLGKEFGLWKPGLCLYLQRDLCCVHGQAISFLHLWSGCSYGWRMPVTWLIFSEQ